MKLSRRIVEFAGAAALITGMTGMEVGISRPAQAAITIISDSAAAARTTTTNTNNVPTSVSQVGEYGENIYEAAKANNWTQVTAKLTSLKDAAKKIDTESKISENPNEDQLDAAIAALNKAVSAKNKLATMRAANQTTLLAANLSAPFNPPVPVQVTLLDYYGRQLEIAAAANNMNQLKDEAPCCGLPIPKR